MSEQTRAERAESLADTLGNTVMRLLPWEARALDAEALVVKLREALERARPWVASTVHDGLEPKCGICQVVILIDAALAVPAAAQTEEK